MDCASAIRLNPNNIKAHYRSAAALLALNRPTEASDVCFRGLTLDPGNVALKRLNESIQSRKEIEDLKSRKRAIEEYKKEKTKFMLEAAIKARQISLRGSNQAPDLEDAEIHLSPDPMDPKSMLVFPVVFLYPIHAQSDFVKQFAEKDAIVDHLSYIFPLPWDTRQEYRIDRVDCYMDTISGGMVKIGKKLSLLQALTTGKTQIVDGLVKIHVVPSSLAGKWI
jgi:Cns1/TTC4 Wheel domain